MCTLKSSIIINYCIVYVLIGIFNFLDVKFRTLCAVMIVYRKYMKFIQLSIGLQFVPEWRMLKNVCISRVWNSRVPLYTCTCMYMYNWSTHWLISVFLQVVLYTCILSLNSRGHKAKIWCQAAAVRDCTVIVAMRGWRFGTLLTWEEAVLKPLQHTRRW